MNGGLRPLKKSLESGLGIRFAGATGDHLFYSTLTQTIFYGMFSAWVSHGTSKDPIRFSWKTAGFIISIPIIQSLFDQLTQSSRVQKLGIIETLNHACEALNRVNTEKFFENFNSDESIQYFYEPFLKEFDPLLQKELGVWYTPPEIVEYMVERIDTVLRNELNVKNGFANENVHVLDPCCGTGAYLIQVLRKIESTYQQQGKDGLIGDDLMKAAKKRLFGFEIMPAPFIVAPWRINEYLRSQGAKITGQSNSNQNRIGVYLTNALTGWEKSVTQKDLFYELQDEYDKASKVKLQKPIWVVLGNPPYNAYAKPNSDEETKLSEKYKQGLVTDWNTKKFNLDDLYIKFISIAEKCITKTGKGIISYISNYSYTTEQSFVVLRKALLDNFDDIWIDNLHGNRKASEYAPDGSTSETVFAMPGISMGIKQGVVVSLLVKKKTSTAHGKVRYRNDIDAGNATVRRRQLLNSLKDPKSESKYVLATPTQQNRYSFKPIYVDSKYYDWPTLVDLCSDKGPYSGLLECRGGVLIDICKDDLADRMKPYFDNNVTWQDLIESEHGMTVSRARFDPRHTRSKAISKETFQMTRIVRYGFKPFDNRWAYYSAVRPLWNDCRPNFWKQSTKNSKYLVSRNFETDCKGFPVFFSSVIGDQGYFTNNSKFFPFHNCLNKKGMLSKETTANLSEKSRLWLSHLGISDLVGNADNAEGPWYHALSICYSPKYVSENQEVLCVDWPRVPIPRKIELFEESILKGLTISKLLDLEDSDIDSVIHNDIRQFGLVQHNDLTINAGWGRKSKGNVTGGKGRIEFREWSGAEKQNLVRICRKLNVEVTRGFELLGKACDIYLNDTNYWKGVPESVWNFRIGSYQVIKKWLSYREDKIIEREILVPEARTVTNIVWRLMTLVLMGDALDKNYDNCCSNSFNWDDLY